MNNGTNDKSPLSLFMTGIIADYTHNPLTFNNLTFITYFLDRRSYFHDSKILSSLTIGLSALISIDDSSSGQIVGG